MKLSTRTYIAISLLALPLTAWAGRPLFTDDATLTIAQTCQIENWFFHSKTMNQVITMPACNPTGNFEVTGGLTETDYIGSGKKEQSYLLQGKTLFVPLDQDHRYGFGFSAGIDRLERATDDNFAYIPFSISSPSQQWTTGLNLGWRQTLLNNKNTLTWGAGTTYSPNPHLSLFSEIFGDNKVKPTLHSGISIGLIPDELQLDITYGDDLSVKKDGGFFTIGLNYYMTK
jgi:hypothetical protein